MDIIIDCYTSSLLFLMIIAYIIHEILALTLCHLKLFTMYRISYSSSSEFHNNYQDFKNNVNRPPRKSSTDSYASAASHSRSSRSESSSSADEESAISPRMAMALSKGQ